MIIEFVEKKLELFFLMKNSIKAENKKNQMHITNEWNKTFMLFSIKLELSLGEELRVEN